MGESFYIIISFFINALEDVLCQENTYLSLVGFLNHEAKHCA